jgi:NB-ARC domain
MTAKSELEVSLDKCQNSGNRLKGSAALPVISPMAELTPTQNSLSMRLSAQGKTTIKQARLAKGWKANDDRWLQAATMRSHPEPIRGWNDYWESNPAAAYAPSDATLKRFLQQRNVRRDSFLALCAAIDVDWQTVIDWEMPTDVTGPIGHRFLGRTTAIRQLRQRLETQSCRLVWLYGRAGMGKTSLINQVKPQIADRFEAVVQISLEQAMTLPELINQVLASLSRGAIQQGDLSDLQRYLKQHHCLIILDQWEAVLAYDSDDRYRPDYADYQNLLTIMSRSHQSCCVVVSRHKLPHFWEATIGETIQSLELGGLSYEEDAAFLSAEGLCGTPDDLARFIGIYNNPLILQLIAETIRTVHNGQVGPFVGPGSIPINPDISRVIQAEFKALSALEQEVVYWLAIWRSPIDFTALHQSFKREISIAHLSDALQTLIGKRSFVKRTEKSAFYLEPVTLKEITNLFVRQVSKELREGSPVKLIASHLFLIGDEDIQIEQQRRIVRSIVEQWQQRSPDTNLPEVLGELRSRCRSDYAPQNVRFLASLIT